MSKLSLAVKVAGLRLRSPLMNAAGVLGMSPPILKRLYDGGAGAVVTKSIGPVPRTGHPNPTLVRTSCGALNAMGLPNPGAECFADEIKALKQMEIPVVASFFGGTSLLIVVGVMLDTVQQIESHLLTRHYEGIMKRGKLKGRR